MHGEINSNSNNVINRYSLFFLKQTKAVKKMVPVALLKYLKPGLSMCTPLNQI